MNSSSFLPHVQKFIDQVFDNLSAIQRRYLGQFVVFAILSGHNVSLSRIKQMWGEERAVSSYCNFLNYDNWDPAQCFAQLAKWVVDHNAPRRRGGKTKVYLSLDLSLFDKPCPDSCFEGFGYLWDAKTESYVWALPVVTINVNVNGLAIPMASRTSASRKVLRNLRRCMRRQGKTPDRRFHYYCRRKCLVREMLREILDVFSPDGYDLWLLFDADFDSNDLLRFCHQNNINVLCAIKKSRLLDTVPLKQHVQALGTGDWQRVTLNNRSGNGEQRYWVATVTGRLKNLPQHCYSVIMSKNNRRGKNTRFFLCSDPEISIQHALEGYQNRWTVEVDYLYVKQFLGAQDFRVRSLRAIAKWIAITFIALAIIRIFEQKHVRKTNKPINTARFIKHLQREAVRRQFKNALRKIQQNYCTKTVLEQLCVMTL